MKKINKYMNNLRLELKEELNNRYPDYARVEHIKEFLIIIQMKGGLKEQ